jgi:phosphohistidine swiveling domain-containing protein
MTVPSCIALDAIGGQSVGGKARGLARLSAAGFDVPPAFVVLGAAPGNLPEDLEEHYLRLGGGRVAVRSSAVGEDSVEASFAGQYETILDVEGVAALRAAVDRCLHSVSNTRATIYREDHLEGQPTHMSVIVQRMVDTRAAGVLFTVNPVNGRRDQLVIDAVRGLGDVLVSGLARPDHWLMSRDGTVTDREIQGSEPVLRDAELAHLLDGALRAERRYGTPLDMEWALDETGRLWWLQARSITGLPADPCELDTRAHPDHVYTWANIGEMMPGAVTPLTYSVTGRGIDIGMQGMYRRIGAQVPYGEGPRYVAMFFGHLFINLTTLAELSAQVAGSTKKQMCLALCGRDVEEVPEPKPEPAFRRAFNGARYFALLASAARHRRELDVLRKNLSLPEMGTAQQLYQAVDENLPRLWRAYELHLLSSASSGALSPILLGILSKGQEPSQMHHAEVAELLAGAKDVESAHIAEGVDRLIDRLVENPDVSEAFAWVEPDAALTWLSSRDAGAASDEFSRYLARHGHRAVRELELRQKEWAVDPAPLISSLQSGVRARLGNPTSNRLEAPAVHAAARHPIIRRLLPLAHAAIRSREHTKSALVKVTTRFKYTYRALGSRLADDGALPDPDAVFFLTHGELGELLAGRQALADLAVRRRRTLDYQMSLQFPKVFKGKPRPLDPTMVEANDGVLVGKPVSRGKVTGRARVVESLQDAAALEAGEILIAPITDVGWTPYFNLIAGLATDVGSAVSHGAVVAREYGLPAVVNLGSATRRFQTGDLVVLDGDAGRLELA